MEIKPIETRYHDCLFRSRLEARWAVFFDTLGVKWEYEKEGYDLGNGDWYLPDFWLAQLRIWVEIKPEEPQYHDSVRQKCGLLARGTEANVILCAGSPGTVEETAEELVGYMTPEYGMELFVGEVATLPHCYSRYHMESLAMFLAENGYLSEGTEFDWSNDMMWTMIELDRDYYRRKYGKEHPHYPGGTSWSRDFAWSIKSDKFTFDQCSAYLDHYQTDARLLDAYRAAKEARFGYVEAPKRYRVA